MQCFEESVLQDVARGRIGEADRAIAEAHLESCASCRARVLAARAAAGESGAGVVPALEMRGLLTASPAATPAMSARPASPGSLGSPGLPDVRETVQSDVQGILTLAGSGAPRRPGRPLDPGDAVGRYVVTGSLGAGGMGVVYGADDPELGRRVALKLLRGDLTEAGGARARLLREAQAMARISHPNVIAVHDVGTWEDQVFLAMELVDGGSLRAWLNARPRGLREILDVFAAAGRGLAAAHSAGLVHRDFKPDNVLVGRDGRVRVTDFGMARTDGEPPPAAAEAPAALPSARAPTSESGITMLDLDLTRTGAVLGTPAYMAPEQHAGDHTDARSDQFSYCVALYEALYGERPFDADSLSGLADAVMSGKVREPPRGATVPLSLRRILLRGLARRPGDRFPTMEMLLAALGRDRTRVPRRIAAISALLALVVGIAFFADWIVRDRVFATTRTSFAAGRGQLDRLLKLRYDTFLALSDLSYVVPVMREVTGNLDEADFGLGEKKADAEQLATLHETLRSADWVTWAKAAGQGIIGIADYKGRLLYTSWSPSIWGSDARALAAVDRALAGAGESAMVVRGDDPGLLASGLTASRPRPGLLVVFARATSVGGVPRAVFIQTIDGAQLLDEVSLADTQLALVAADGASAGNIPDAVLQAGLRARSDADEVRDRDSSWLVQSSPLRGLTGPGEVATIVLARRVDLGLAGLFANARTLLGLLAAFLVALSLASWSWARRGVRQSLQSPARPTGT